MFKPKYSIIANTSVSDECAVSSRSLFTLLVFNNLWLFENTGCNFKLEYTYSKIHFKNYLTIRSESRRALHLYKIIEHLYKIIEV